MGFAACRGAMLLDWMQSLLALQHCSSSCCCAALTWRHKAVRCMVRRTITCKT